MSTRSIDPATLSAYRHASDGLEQAHKLLRIFNRRIATCSCGCGKAVIKTIGDRKACYRTGHKSRLVTYKRKAASTARRLWKTESYRAAQEATGFNFSNRDKIPNLGKLGSETSNWRGGRSVTTQGYVLLTVSPNHEFASMATLYGSTPRVPEHRLVAATVLGRALSSDELVHHRNSDRADNRIENLVVMSRPDHTRLHSLLSAGVSEAEALGQLGIAPLGITPMVSPASCSV